MIKRVIRELYLLPRGEQRAMVLLSILLILSILTRIWVQALPGREPAGMDDFIKESRAIMIAIAREDSLSRSKAALSHRNTSSGFVTGRSPLSRSTAASSRSTAASSRSTAASSRSTAAPSRSTAASSRSTAAPSRSTAALSPIPINTADSAQLLPLPGIGPVFAGRIIKYRKLLGGFISIDQLYEVYGLKEETIQAIREQIYIDTLEIRKMDINHATFGELLRHPYLEMDHVKALVNYRNFAGRVDSIQELHDNHLIPDSALQKVLPYLQINR